MNQYAFRILIGQPLRLALTVFGTALCIVLMLFLLSIYQGVKEGSVEYIQKNEADLWILQRNAWNILRGSSILSMGHGKFIEELPGVETVAPVLLILSGIKHNGKITTVFLTGFDPEKKLGGPPQIIEGHSIKNNHEIVLDKSFAAKFHFHIGDVIQIQDDTLTIVGLSDGTNALVIQYAFATLKQVQSLIGFPNIVTCFLIKIKEGFHPDSVTRTIKDELPDLEVYDQKTFLQNNIREMETGFLPFLYTVAIIGMIVLTTILSLLLSINILEQRKDYAVLKILGSSKKLLWRLILDQSMIIIGTSLILAFLLFFPLTLLIEHIYPEISTKTSLIQIIAVTLITSLMGILSAIISINRIRKIYPMEAFA
jgi:ABC-type antimicrobial peptide transport system permease subunit